MLTFSFSGADGVMTVAETLTSGMIGKKVKMEFTSDWNGLTKTAVYVAGNITHAVSCEAGENEIPAEVLAVPYGCLCVGVFGESADGTLVIPTILVRGPRIRAGVDPLQAPPSDPPVSAYEKLLDMMGNLDELETEDKSSLVAAINEAAKSGGGSSDSGQNGDNTPEIKSILTDVVTFLKAVPFDDTVVSASDLDDIQNKIDALGSGNSGGTDEDDPTDEPPDEPVETVSATFSNGELAISGMTANSATFDNGILAVA